MGAKLAVSQIDLYALQVFSTREFKILNFGSDKFIKMGLLVRLSAVTLPLGPASISSVFDILDLELELDFFSFLLDLIVFFKFSLSSFVSDIEPNLVNIKKI